MKSDMDFEQEKQQKTERKRALGCLIFTIVVLAISTTVGLLVHSLRPQPTLQGDILVRTEPVGDCHPQPGGDQDKCEAAGCTWKQVEGGGPSCTFPSGYGYKMSDEPVMTPLGQKVDLERILQTRDLVQGSPHINKLTVEVQEFSKDTLRVLYQDYADNRYKVPAGAIVIPVEGKPSKPDDKDKLYDIEFIKEPQFGVKVTRRSTNTVIFDTSITGFIFSEQYLQITNRLPSSHLYGLGEHNHRQFKHDMNWRKWTLFTRDVAPVDEWNLYGQQPHYMNLENDSNANAVLLLNSNAMDVVLQPDDYPAITYHVIGGVLDFYIFLGPTPENVVQQYTWATGRPMLPPYWSLGFQLSRWDYHNLTHVEEIIDRNRKEGIPLDVQYGDIDYMESKLDFTYDKVLYKDLPAFIDRIHSYGMKYIIILDHCIGSNETLVDEKLGGTYLPLSQGKDKDVFIIDPRNKQPLEGEVWPGVVYYPDFTNNSTVTDWWIDQCNDFYSGPRWGVKYDALWIDMNEPSNFLPGSMTGCEKNKLNNPPYIPNVLGAGDDGRLYDKTICMDAEQNWGKHYNVHSLYGHSMAIVTWKTLKDQFPDKRPLVLTRSQFTGSQKYAGHWLGDNQSQWRQIPWSIIVKEISCKMKNLRTLYTKAIHRESSGSEAKDDTPRIQWIVKSLAFLKPYMQPRKTRGTKFPKSKGKGPADETSAAATCGGYTSEDALSQNQPQSSFAVVPPVTCRSAREYSGTRTAVVEESDNNSPTEGDLTNFGPEVTFEVIAAGDNPTITASVFEELTSAPGTSRQQPPIQISNTLPVVSVNNSAPVNNVNKGNNAKSSKSISKGPSEPSGMRVPAWPPLRRVHLLGESLQSDSQEIVSEIEEEETGDRPASLDAIRKQMQKMNKLAEEIQKATECRQNPEHIQELPDDEDDTEVDPEIDAEINAAENMSRARKRRSSRTTVLSLIAQMPEAKRLMIAVAGSLEKVNAPPKPFNDVDHLGKEICERVKNITDPRARTILINALQQCCFRTEMGQYDRNTGHML